MKKITVITGHYGSGKSTFAANYAIKCAEQGEQVTVVDMDTVNPYYRTADLGELFARKGVKLCAPMYAGTNLDVPILNFDIPAIYAEGRKLVIDMGGDDAGAYPLGKFRSFLEANKEETEILYVVNFCRYLTRTPEEAEEILREIEAACGLKATAMVNNSNLGFETDSDVIAAGIKQAEMISKQAELPIFCHTVPVLENRTVSAESTADIFPVEIYIKNVWN